jgi:RNA polymerase sigma-70 factor (ECF subfamily)
MELPSSQRLSRISTLWTLLERAHAGPADQSDLARKALMHRYAGAAYRYLLGAVRDEDAAADLFQEFALRMLRGDFHGADPARGRFRSYVKTSLINLVNEHRRQQRREPAELVSDPPAPRVESTDDFLAVWKRHLTDSAWNSLRDENLPLHTVLYLHVQDHQISSQQAADELTRRFDREYTANNARVMLHRARDKFAEHLLREIEASMPGCSADELETELRELSLLKLCEPALARRETRESKPT